MPSAVGAVGVKLASVAPGNAARGLPRIQGAYVLFDPETLAPVAVLDAAALTAVRTAAVSALAVRFLADPDASRLLVWGTGPQAWAHVEAVSGERPIARIDVVGRTPTRLAAFLERCHEAGHAAQAAGPGALAQADVVCCCTTAREPLFDGAGVRREATVVAVGSHEPGARELDTALMHRGWVVVEAASAALREAGEVVQAVGGRRAAARRARAAPRRSCAARRSRPRAARGSSSPSGWPGRTRRSRPRSSTARAEIRPGPTGWGRSGSQRPGGVRAWAAARAGRGPRRCRAS